MMHGQTKIKYIYNLVPQTTLFSSTICLFIDTLFNCVVSSLVYVALNGREIEYIKWECCGRERVLSKLVYNPYIWLIFSRSKSHGLRITATCKNVRLMPAQATKFRRVEPNIFKIITAVLLLADELYISTLAPSIK